jgi:hypothetical protein
MTVLGVTCLRDDGPYVVEWVAHHLAVGMDHILVLSHDCTDGSDVLLDALQASGRVTHLRFAPKGGKSVQWQALKLAGDHPQLARANWVMVFDCDEFLSLDPACADIPGCLDAVQAQGGQADAVAIPWRLFGSDGQVGYDPALTPERFRHAAPRNLQFPMAHLFKSLFRPKAFQKPGVHRPRRKPRRDAVWLSAWGERLPDSFVQNDGMITLYTHAKDHAPLAEFNHYSLRSRDEFMVKRHRGLPNHTKKPIDVGYWVERNWNTVEDSRIDAMLPATRDMAETLMALPNVRPCHEATVAAHQSRFAQIMQNVDEVRFHWQLGLTINSTPPSPEASRIYLRAMAAARGNKG